MLNLRGEISLYGSGDVVRPLFRKGQSVKLLNTDTAACSVEGEKRLYQTHPWVVGVSKDDQHLELYLAVHGKLNFIRTQTKLYTIVKERFLKCV